MVFETRYSFFPLNRLKYLKYKYSGFLFKIWKHIPCQIIIPTLCVEYQTLYVQLQWTNAFFVLCHLWKGPYGNIRRTYKNCVPQLWMPLVLAKSRGIKFLKKTTESAHTHTRSRCITLHSVVRHINLCLKSFDTFKNQCWTLKPLPTGQDNYWKIYAN